MTKSTAPKSITNDELKAEAEDLMLKHCNARRIESLLEAKMAIDAFETSQLRRMPYRPPVDSPWVAAMMQAAVMPDNSLCRRTVRSHAVAQGELLTIHTGPQESSLELRQAMEAAGCIWAYSDIHDPEEGEETYHYAEVTGFGLAKFVGADLHKLIADTYKEHRTAA